MDPLDLSSFSKVYVPMHFPCSCLSRRSQPAPRAAAASGYATTPPGIPQVTHQVISSPDQQIFSCPYAQLGPAFHRGTHCLEGAESFFSDTDHHLTCLCHLPFHPNLSFPSLSSQGRLRTLFSRHMQLPGQFNRPPPRPAPVTVSTLGGQRGIWKKGRFRFGFSRADHGSQLNTPVWL